MEVKDKPRIGTVYFDESAAEYVMPADFVGDEELRWKAETGQKPGHRAGQESEKSLHEGGNEEDSMPDRPEDYDVVGVSRTYRAPVHPPAPDSSYVGLEEQKRLYSLRFEREVDRLWDALADEVYVRHIYELGLQRLIEGYKTFRDDAFHWTTQRRQAEADEELADYLVYSCTEDD